MDYRKLKKALYLICVGYGFWQMQEHWFVIHYDSLPLLKFIPWWLSTPFFFIALGILEKHIPDTKFLKPLCIIMGVIDLAEWIIIVFDIKIPFELYMLQILSSVISLYFNYQLITNISQLAKKCGYENIKGMLQIRTVHTIYVTVYTLLLPFAEKLMTWQFIPWVGWYNIVWMVGSVKTFIGYLKDLQKQEEKQVL